MDQLPLELVVLTRLDEPATWIDRLEAANARTLVALARHHRLDGRLASVLEAHAVGSAWAHELRRRRDERAGRFLSQGVPQLETLLGALTDRGVEPVALKGASLVSAGVLPAGERDMVDLDVLVGREAIPAALDAAKELGYRSSQQPGGVAGMLTRHYQVAPLDHPDHLYGLDLHWHIQVPHHRQPFVADDLRTTALTLPTGYESRRLDDVDELTHLSLHFLKDRARGRSGALGQLRDVKVAALRLEQDGWRELRTRAERRGHLRSVAAVLALAHVLMAMPLPQGFPEVSELHDTEQLHSFAIRRVLAPRPAHVQLAMVTPDVRHTPYRIATRVASYVRGGPPPDARPRLSGWVRHLGYVARLLGVAVRQPLNTAAELRLDRWAHELDSSAPMVVRDPRQR